MIKLNLLGIAVVVMLNVAVSHAETRKLTPNYYIKSTAERFSLNINSSKPSIVFDKIYRNTDLFNPTDIVRFKDKYVATELFENQLAIFEDLSFKNLTHFNPNSIDRQFKNPHYMAVSKKGSLLITNGWGNSIVEIQNLKGEGWKEFFGVEKFNGPHGICVDDVGWIYVADSKNARLVRFKDLDGKDWQVFKDKDNVIGYIRQLVCRNGEVWAANNYEELPGVDSLKRGSTILRIADFESGKVEKIISLPHTNTTGIFPFEEKIIWAEWSSGGTIMSASLKEVHPRLELSEVADLGVPYSFYHDKKTNKLIVSYFGRLYDTQRNLGGFLTFSIYK